MEMSKKEKTKKVLGIIGNVAIWVFVALSLLVTILVLTSQKDDNYGIPNVFGKGIVSIQTGSMEPNYKIGDLVFVDVIKKEDLQKASSLEDLGLKIGDVITFKAPKDLLSNIGEVVVKKGEFVTHRIVESDQSDRGWRTKGDAEPIKDRVDDFDIMYTDIVGKAGGRMAGMGNVINFLKSQLGFFLCIVLPMLLFFIYQLYNFITVLVNEKNKNKAEALQETEEEIKQRAIKEYLESIGQAPKTDTPSEEKKEE